MKDFFQYLSSIRLAWTVFLLLGVCNIHSLAQLTNQAQQPDARIVEICSLLYQREYKSALTSINTLLGQSTNDNALQKRLLTLKSSAERGLDKVSAALQSQEQLAALLQAQSSQTDRGRWKQEYEQVLQTKMSTVGLEIASAKSIPSDSMRNMAMIAKTLEQANNVIQVNPYNGIARYQRAFALFSEQLYDSAAFDFRIATEHLPPIQAASAYFHLGLCKFKTNNPSEAVAAFSKSIELAPFHGESYFYRGCMYALGEQFSLAMQDFTNAVRLNPNDAPSSGMLGSLLISTGKRTEGCIRLTRSYQLGYAPAMPIIERYCSNGVAEDGSKIVRLPTVTVDADRINYAQRVKNTKQGIAMAQRIRSPFQQHSRNLTQPKGFNAGTLFIPDGNAVAAVPVETPSNLPSSPTSIPLQAIINKADCNSAVINTQSFVSIPCIAYFFAQETKPFDNPDIQKIVKKIQLLSDEIVVLQYAIGNVTPGSYAVPTASGTDALSADFGRLSTMYDTFMTLVAQLQNKLSLHEVVLQKEGKL